MSAASTETSAPLPTAGSRVFFQAATGVGCVGSGPITGEDPVQKKQGKVTVKYDRKELRKRLVLEEWIIEQLSDLYDCEVSGAEIVNHTRLMRSGSRWCLYLCVCCGQKNPAFVAGPSFPLHQ
uniref:Uncharacterized protein n=1 Tax=Monopterus albus TaxID=43700 RepID=A0A3Q3QYV2_MONAL